MLILRVFIWLSHELSVQFSRSVMSDSVTPWTAARQASLSITSSQSSLKLTSTESEMPSNHLILCRPLLLPPSIFPIISSVQFSHSVVSNSLWPHGLQYARPPCPSPAPRVDSNSRPLNQWCHQTISFSVVPFSSCLPSFLASVSFPRVSSWHQVAKVLEFQRQH